MRGTEAEARQPELYQNTHTYIIRPRDQAGYYSFNDSQEQQNDNVLRNP